mmetsp:Transcript_3687/g.10675  ORF Transcript_3687/g.10675 Transcript_3687/m.10675 type:complete len:900 (+) Transcript_3687:3737-6436(+)
MAAMAAWQAGAASFSADCALPNVRGSHAARLCSQQPFRQARKSLLLVCSSRGHANPGVLAAVPAGAATSAASIPKKATAVPKQGAKLAAKQSKGQETLWYRTPSSLGPDVQVVSTVQHTGKGFTVTIYLPKSAADADATVSLQWGTYRTSPAKWFHPKGSVPSGSAPAGNAMRSPMTSLSASKTSDGGDGWQAQLEFGAELAPLTLAFTVHLTTAEAQGGAEMSVKGRLGRPFAVPIGMGAGSPEFLGPTIRAGSDAANSAAVNFCVRSRAATAVSLVLLRDGGEKFMEVALDPDTNRTGDAWHVELRDLKNIETLTYGWRADASDISRFYPGQVMLDPYCRAISRVRLPDGCQTVAPNIMKSSGRTDPNTAVLGSLACLSDVPEWAGQPRPQPQRLPRDDIILELDVATFTSNVDGEQRGKLLGVLQRLDAVRASGATTVMLAPVLACAPGLGPHGRAPVSFFAVEPGLAVGLDAAAPARELRQLVAGLHAAGLSVLCQVQYCFTGEGGPQTRNPSSLLGLDADLYYRGNGVLSSGHAAVRRLITASLGHLASDFRLDGFCFLNAESLTHDRDGTVLDAPPLAHELASAPALASLRMMAAPADLALLPRGGARGFPHWGLWSERSGRFGSDIVRFLAEGSGGANLAAAAEQLAGGPRVFAALNGSDLPGNLAVARPPAAAVNAATVLGAGPSLRKAVDDSLWNFPPHQDPAYGCASHQDALVRSFLVSMLLSRGTPCITQDVLWEEALVRFVGVLAELRQEYLDLLQPPSYTAAPPFNWHGSYAGSTPDWEGYRGGSPGCNFLGYSLVAEQRALYVGLNNSGGGETITLPQPPAGTSWRLVADSGRPAPNDVSEGPNGETLGGGNYYLQPKSSLVLVAAVNPAPVRKATPSPRPAAVA